jgi:uncharacterized protein (DUF1697 family)
MAHLIALLRGINVGGHKKVPMADLRALCPALGFCDAQTYIQSGNLVFTAGGASKAAEKLEQAIAKRFGFPVDVIVRTAAQWATYAARPPFPAACNEEPNRVLLVLSKAPPKAGALTELSERATAGEKIASAEDAIWIYYPGDLAKSKVTPGLIDRAIGSPVTTRNWKTVCALQAVLAKNA